jgi:heme/copper-type cytochrome/quinol oxidase subunit 1
MPALWLTLTAVNLVEGLASEWLATWPGDYSHQDVYYLIAHARYGLGLLAACLLFAAGYWALGKIKTQYREWLAYGHFGLFGAGLLILFAPQIVLAIQGKPKRLMDFADVFAVWNTVASVAYVMMWVGLALFVALLIDLAWRATRRKAAPNKP